MRLLSILLLMFSCLAYGQQINPNKLPPCPTPKSKDWDKCWGGIRLGNGSNYQIYGEFRAGKLNGYGIEYEEFGGIYEGTFDDGVRAGIGKLTDLAPGK